MVKNSNSLFTAIRAKPDVTCVQGLWLKPRLDFIIQGYVAIRKDGEEVVGGGSVTFVKEGIPYRGMDGGNDLECVIVEVWAGKKKLDIEF